MSNDSLLYGIIGALGVVAIGGGAYIAKQHGAFDPAVPPAALTAAAPAPIPAPAPPPPPPAPKPPLVAAPKPVQSPPPVPAGPTAAQAEQLRQLVLDARRAITHGDFNSADRALDQAERIDARAADVLAARRDLHDAQQHTQRQERRIDAMVADARAAIGRHDYTAADRLLDQAEKRDARDRDVVHARAELKAAQQRSLVAEARGALAHHDLATADRLLDQAEHIDARDRDVKQARAELNAAQRQADRDSDRRIDALVAQARSAITRHDYATADRLLDQAEHIDAHDRDVQQARAELNAAGRPGSGQERR